MRNCGSSDEARTPDARQTDVAATLLSRDYKGLSNYGSNAAIECKRVGFHRESINVSALRMVRTEIPEQFHKFIYEINGELYLIRIRKLTPLECWRLMGFTDEDYWKAASVNSNTQLYKQAGNSIVKQVLMKVFSQMIPTKNKVTALKQKALALLDF